MRLSSTAVLIPLALFIILFNDRVVQDSLAGEQTEGRPLDWAETVAGSSASYAVSTTVGGLDARDSIVYEKEYRLGFAIPGFAHEGDLVFEYEWKYFYLASRPGEWKGLVWVHSESSNAFLIAGKWDNPKSEDRVTTQPAFEVAGSAKSHDIRLVGAPVATQADARFLLESKFRESFPGEKAEGSRMGEMAVQKHGYTVPGFASMGDQAWEGRVLDDEGRLLSIAWINPRTEQVRYLISPAIATDDRPTTRVVDTSGMTIILPEKPK